MRGAGGEGWGKRPSPNLSEGQAGDGVGGEGERGEIWITRVAKGRGKRERGASVFAAFAAFARSVVQGFGLRTRGPVQTCEVFIR